MALAQSEYTPLLWRTDLLLERHYGWTLVQATDLAKILSKNQGPLRKYMALSRGEAPDRFEALIRPCIEDRRAIVVYHDLTASGPAQEPTLGGKRFALCDDSSRLYNIATFVVDLDLDEEKLWAAFGNKSRNMVRRGTEHGLSVAISEKPGVQELGDFFGLYRPMAKRLGLAMPPESLLKGMSERGELASVTCRTSSDVVAVNLVFVAAPHAMYSYGARRTGSSDSGQLMQWETIRYLKTKGVRWYDLGGIPSKILSGGIYDFKKSLGGEFVDLGWEYQYVSPLIYFPYKWYKRSKSLLAAYAPD